MGGRAAPARRGRRRASQPGSPTSSASRPRPPRASGIARGAAPSRCRTVTSSCIDRSPGRGRPSPAPPRQSRNPRWARGETTSPSSATTRSFWSRSTAAGPAAARPTPARPRGSQLTDSQKFIKAEEAKLLGSVVESRGEEEEGRGQEREGGTATPRSHRAAVGRGPAARPRRPLRLRARRRTRAGRQACRGAELRDDQRLHRGAARANERLAMHRRSGASPSST